eukprot:jgi/Bigna1/126542/aug1.2_g1250
MDLCKRRKNCRRIVTLPGCCQILLINFSLILSILFFIAQHEFFHEKILTSRSPWRCCRRISSTTIRLIGRSSSRSPPLLVDVAAHRRRKEELRVASSHVITGSEPGPPYSLQNAQTDNDLECTSVLAGEMVDNIANTDHYLGPGSLGEDFQYGDGKGWGTALETEDVVSKIASAYKIDPSEVRARLKAINQTVSNMIKRAESAAPRVTRDLKYIADWLKGEVAGLPQAVDASTIRTVERISGQMPEFTPECVERRFKDVLRFTLIYNDSPPGLHVTNIKVEEEEEEEEEEEVLLYQYLKEEATLNDLEDQGYIVEQVKNYWPRHGDNYCGVNCVLRTPHGVSDFHVDDDDVNESGIRWELQFHTPLSARTNAGTHSIFEEYRSATVNVQRKRELFDRISLPWKHVPVPYRMLDRRHKLHPSMRTIRLNRP